MSDHDRPYDVVLWGATGYTGRLVARHLAATYGADGLDWAIAGRDRQALDALRHRLGDVDPACAGLDVLLGDALDRPSLDAIAEQAAVVCTAVGPYTRYGTPLVAACLEHGTDYCDLAGEPPWMRRIVDEHHEAARRRGLRLVQACGFDSVPSDLGTLLVQEAAEEAFGEPCAAVRTTVRAGSLRLSGGTHAASVEAARATRGDPSLARAMADPHALTGDDEAASPAGSPRGPRFDEDLDTWTGPFVMATINEKVVHRSHALLGRPWGEGFAYSEATPTGSGLAGAARAYGLAAGLGLYLRLLSVGPVRRALERYVLPAPGTGPSDRALAEGAFEFRLRGFPAPRDGATESRVEARVSAPVGPYAATGWMAGEAAVCLARGETDSRVEGGVLTPATAIGRPLVQRLGAAGMSFEISRTGAGG